MLRSIITHDILPGMFTHFSSRLSQITRANVTCGVKCLFILPQNIEHKISTFYVSSYKTKGQMNDLADYREMIHPPKTALHSILLPIFACLEHNWP